ncbi:MAG: hypothetical protein QUS12_13465 [Methanosarcina sp.]|nr:hypothetical protein [Methanosarcina sp.]
MKRINLIKGKKEQPVKRGGVGKYALFVAAGVLAVSSVLMTVETAGSGAEVASLRKEQTELSKEQRSLENTLARSLSMNDLEKKGTELGYAKPFEMIYISGSKESVAQLP